MRSLPIVFLLSLTLFVTACSTETSSSSHNGAAASTTSTDETEPSKVPPHRGMTAQEVRKLYGDPDHVRVSPAGQSWFYFFNKGYYYIPFYFGAPRTGVFDFDANGILVDFRYNG